jgi:hypothetical protein
MVKCSFICIYIYIYIYIYTYIYIHAHIHTYFLPAQVLRAFHHTAISYSPVFLLQLYGQMFLYIHIYIHIHTCTHSYLFSSGASVESLLSYSNMVFPCFLTIVVWSNCPLGQFDTYKPNRSAIGFHSYVYVCICICMCMYVCQI